MSNKPITEPFYSLLRKRPTEPAPAGKPTAYTYTEMIDKDGKKRLEQTGETSTYNMIQAELQNTLVYNILARFQMGDESIIQQIPWDEADVTDAPQNLAEAQRILIEMESNFNKMPIEIRRECNFSPSEFIAKYSSGEIQKFWADEQAKKNPEPEEIKIPEVKENAIVQP